MTCVFESWTRTLSGTMRLVVVSLVLLVLVTAEVPTAADIP